MDCQKVISNIRNNFREYMIKANLKSIIIGISGGIDSALCAALLKPVMDDLNLPLIGVSLPTSSNKKGEVDRADLIGEEFCTKYHIQPISVPVDVLYDSIGLITSEFEFNWDSISDHNFKIMLGNIMARTRMVILYGLAGIYKGMVIFTDNYTEYLLGFWTLHGDVGDYGPIQGLWKTEVYELAQSIVTKFSLEGNDTKALALLQCIQAIPTDGLGITNSDLEQLEAKSYTEVDEYLNNILSEEKVINDTFNKIKQRYLDSQFKRNNPYNINRHFLLQD